MTTQTANDRAFRDSDRSNSFSEYARSQGYEQELAWVLRRPGKSEDNSAAAAGASTEEQTNGPESAAARKTKQRAKDDARGWRQCNVKAPDDDDARTLMADIGRRLIDREFRAAIRLAATRPELVGYGAKAASLGGIRGAVLRAMLGGLPSRGRHERG
jgi:hypothetical protein